MAASADKAWHDYRDAIEDARSSAAPGVERSGGISGEIGSLDRIMEASVRLHEELALAQTTRTADIQDLASMKLLAAAAYDLGLAKDLIDKNKSGGEKSETERSAVAVFVDPTLREVLDAPLERGMKSFLTERSAGPPDVNAARAGLGKKAETVIRGIVDRSAKVLMFTGTGVTTFGLGPAQEWASALAQEIGDISGRLGTFVRYAVRLVREAIQKLWSAFGKDQQKEIQSEAKSWIDSVLGKPQDIVSGLLKSVYAADELRKEIADEIAGKSPSTSPEQWNKATGDLDELLARYEKSCATLEWVVRGIGWAKSALMTLSPWGPAIAYAGYVGAVGYTVYSGGDYLDAKRFSARWLDQVSGVGGIIKAI